MRCLHLPCSIWKGVDGKFLQACRSSDGESEDGKFVSILGSNYGPGEARIDRQEGEHIEMYSRG